MHPETERLIENSFKEQEKKLKRYQILVFFLTYLSYFALYMTRRPISVTKTRLKDKEGVDGFELAVIDTVYLSMYAVGQFSNGIFADRIGSRKILVIGLLGSGVSCCLFGTVSLSGVKVVVFVLTWGINGYFQACGWPGCIKGMTPWFSAGTRGTVMGWWSTCYQIGGIAGAAFATLIMDQLGWRWAYVIPSLLVGFTALLVFAFMPEKPDDVGLVSPLDAEDEEIVEEIGAGAVASASAPSGISYTTINSNNNDSTSSAGSDDNLLNNGNEQVKFMDVLFMPGVVNLGISYAIIKLIRYSLSYWLAYYLEEKAGYSDVNAGYLSIAFDSGGTLGSIAIGFLSDTLFGGRRVTVCFPSLLLVAGSFILYIFFSDTGTTENAVILVLIGFFLFGPDTLLSSSTAQDIGGVRAAASVAGMVNGLGSLGAILQAFTTYLVSKYYGWDAFWYMLSGLSVIAALSIIPLMRKELSPTWKPQTKNHKK